MLIKLPDCLVCCLWILETLRLLGSAIYQIAVTSEIFSLLEPASPFEIVNSLEAVIRQDKAPADSAAEANILAIGSKAKFRALVLQFT